jgi:hypothetical protein
VIRRIRLESFSHCSVNPFEVGGILEGMNVHLVFMSNDGDAEEFHGVFASRALAKAHAEHLAKEFNCKDEPWWKGMPGNEYAEFGVREFRVVEAEVQTE